MKRKEYFKQSFWNVSVKIVVIAIIVFLSCLAAGITWGILYLMEHFMSSETVGIILFSIAAIILAYYIIKYSLMLIFNIYHFFVWKKIFFQNRNLLLFSYKMCAMKKG